jgi:predicted NAD/FAD-binding protein
MMAGTAAQQLALGGIEFHNARLALHTDPIYSPANPDYRSFYNGQIQNGSCETSMWLADVLAGVDPATAATLWKSWTTHRAVQPVQLVTERQFRHMLPTPQTLQAQTELLGLQGQQGIWFAGGYTRPYDSQETALVSALDVAQGLLAA